MKQLKETQKVMKDIYSFYNSQALLSTTENQALQPSINSQALLFIIGNKTLLYTHKIQALELTPSSQTQITIHINQALPPILDNQVLSHI